MMTHPTVLLDACVLFPASLRDLLLRAAWAQLFEARWSNEIWDEVTRNLVSTNRMTVKQATHLRTEVAAFFPRHRNRVRVPYPNSHVR